MIFSSLLSPFLSYFCNNHNNSTQDKRIGIIIINKKTKLCKKAFNFASILSFYVDS